MRSVFEWNIGRRSLSLGKRTLIAGVVNVTPDSFSDGGLYLDPEQAVSHGLKLLDDGADIIDIGGESTRPGAKVFSPTAPKNPALNSAVTEEEELRRVVPVITALKKARPDCVISVDTYKASVARKAVELGAEIVNDVSGFRWDPRMVKTLAELKCGAILMHSRGRPDEWHTMPPASDIVLQAKRDFRDWVDAALMAGVKRERIVLDPGFGFGKSYEENYPLLKRFEELHQLRYPLVAGVSRKSFIGRAIARNGKDATVDERGYGTIAAETAAILKGAHIIRTHDVKAAVDAARVADLAV
jgi:dihydropteroate synthase